MKGDEVQGGEDRDGRNKRWGMGMSWKSQDPGAPPGGSSDKCHVHRAPELTSSSEGAKADHEAVGDTG